MPLEYTPTSTPASSGDTLPGQPEPVEETPLSQQLFGDDVAYAIYGGVHGIHILRNSDLPLVEKNKRIAQLTKAAKNGND